jgi:hypothetical protein
MRQARCWPWLLLAFSTLPAVWYVWNFEHDIDPELPGIVRPTFSTYPPAAYRLGDAGDTIDHIAVYVSSAALVLACWGLLRNPRGRAWAAAAALSAAGFWHAATPAPLLDGWYGLGWRSILDPRAPVANRLILALVASCIVAIDFWAMREKPLRSWWHAAREHGILGLLIAAGGLVAARQVGWLDREPIGFWPRWIYVWGMLAWGLALAKVAPAAPPRWLRGAILACLVAASLGLDFAGRGLFRYQRPLHRLREVVPGRLYISEMPSYWSLKLTQDRFHFRTIINLFPEHTPEQSRDWADELRFAREHGINYVGNPSTDGTGGERFVVETIKLARNPTSWPVLVHCHASMDRSPAWMGIYRFVVQGWPLADALREIERHRGLRPKGAVTLLYLHLLPQLAPERCAADPTFALLRECAASTGDPAAELAAGSSLANDRISRRNTPDRGSRR